jgi:Cof subfamily protein (haloacid dehalogenase superfamily)
LGRSPLPLQRSLTLPRFRLLAIDLDGTLLSSSREVSAEDQRAIARARAAGVAVAIVTGRRFPAVRPYVAPLGDELFVVANSGALVRKGARGPILRRRFLRISIASFVLEIASKVGMEPLIHDGPEAEGYIFLTERARNIPQVHRYLNRASPPPSWVDELVLERDPVQVGFTGTVAGIRGFETELGRRLEAEHHRVHLARTEYPVEDFALLDVLAIGATKSRALAFLRRSLGLAREETMAIGDNWNDLGMLESAGLGVMMRNAAEELRQLGFAETGTNDEAGVAEAIDRYLL